MIKRKDKSGFTLIEIVVAITLVSIVSVFLVSSITPIFTISGEIGSEIEAMSMCDTVYNHINNKLQFLEEFNIPESNRIKYKIPENADEKEINGSQIGKEIFPDTEYNILVTFSSNDNRVLDITIKIYDKDNKEISSKNGTLLPPNLTR